MKGMSHKGMDYGMEYGKGDKGGKMKPPKRKAKRGSARRK